MQRRFDIGRSKETLLDDQFYDIFKILEPYLKYGDPNSPDSGPPSDANSVDEVSDGALWLDRTTDLENSDLKYFSNNKWNLLFKDRFKITQDIIATDNPDEPIEGQLWITPQGVLNYYFRGVWKPIKAIPDNYYEDPNLQGFEDFILISPLNATERRIVDNFTSWLLSEVPLKHWDKDTDYIINQGVILDLDIYICKVEHTSTDSNKPGHYNLESKYNWVKLEKLFQYLVPNSYEDKFYVDGYFMHERCKKKEVDLVPTAITGTFKANEKTAQHLMAQNGGHIHTDSCMGYEADTNVSISIPVEYVEGKHVSGVHVNPKRLHNVSQKFIMIDKAMPVVEVEELNTEYYGFHGGVGRLLIKTENPNTTDYTSVVSRNKKCIQLSKRAADMYDFVYALTYEFNNNKIKELGTVDKKRQELNEENYIWIGPADPTKIAVFNQGLYYAEDPGHNPSWAYNPETEYLHIREKLQDDENFVKTFDFSVIQFPEKYEGKVTDSFEVVNGVEMFRLVLPVGYPKSESFTVFASGININLIGGEVIRHATNKRILYIPSITKQMYLESLQNAVPNDKPTPIFYCVVGTKGVFDGKEVDMFRGLTAAKYDRQKGVHIPIYQDSKYPVEGALLLKDEEEPILFVDGILTFQREIERGNDFITIYGLKEGQGVLLLADKKDVSINNDEPSDSIIFEDTVSYSTIPTPQSDCTIVYVANSILCNASSVYTSSKPIGEGFHGEIRYHINYDADSWYRYDAINSIWNEILPTETVLNPVTGDQEILIEVLDSNARGYTHSKKSISFLQNINDKVCTYMAYKYSDSIEKPLLMGYCYPNDKDGVHVSSTSDSKNPQPFKTGTRHVYLPGKNELTVYLNGVMQKFNNVPGSKNREGYPGKYDEFILALDDGSQAGLPIKAEEGYIVYSLKKWNEQSTLIPDDYLTPAEIAELEKEGWKVSLVSAPTRNVIFYVIEGCEGNEKLACERTVLTYKDSLSSQGAFVNNTYVVPERDFFLTRGNIRVFINGIRQPFGAYSTLESSEFDNPYLQAYKIIDQKTIEICSPLIGGLGGNEGDINNPLFPIGTVNGQKVYHDVIDEIMIETRRDFKLREVTIPIKDNSGIFTREDNGLPEELFKTKDRVMIYINGLAYGKEYKIEDKQIKLLNSDIKNMLGNSKKDVITFEWR